VLQQSRFKTCLPRGTSAFVGYTDGRINDYNFDIKRCTSFEGDFGPFIQYSYVRLCSVQRKNPNVIVPTSVDEINLAVLDEPKVHDIINHLAAYPDAVNTAYIKREPSTLVTWCFKMSHLVGTAWETVKVTHASEEEARARLFLFVNIRDVLGHAMKLLSLTLIERM
jgi:arginyl-tRNA synthetase